MSESQITNNLKEIHYIPFNTSNSLTIYSYSQFRNHVLTATKENFIKDVYFKYGKSSSSSEETTEAASVGGVENEDVS